MAKPRNKLKDYLAYLAVRMFAAWVLIWDYRDNYMFAAWIGNMMFLLDRRHRRRAIEHLRRSFPDWKERRYRQVAKASMRNLVYLGLELLCTTRMISQQSWARHVRLTNLSAMLREILQRHSGLIVLTGHYGNWEVLGYTMAMLGIPTVSIARRLDNPYLDQFIFGIRRKTGQVIIDKRGASQVAPDVLDNKGVVGFIADQDAGRKGAFVDFFGRKASTYKSIALLAIQHQAPVVIGFGRRLEEDFQFELGVERIIYPTEWADKPDPVMWITQEYTSVLEQVIRRTPDQYLWVHRRWKHRPKGEPKAVDGIA